MSINGVTVSFFVTWSVACMSLGSLFLLDTFKVSVSYCYREQNYVNNGGKRSHSLACREWDDRLVPYHPLLSKRLELCRRKMSYKATLFGNTRLCFHYSNLIVHNIMVAYNHALFNAFTCVFMRSDILLHLYLTKRKG